MPPVLHGPPQLMFPLPEAARPGAIPLCDDEIIVASLSQVADDSRPLAAVLEQPCATDLTPEHRYDIELARSVPDGGLPRSGESFAGIPHAAAGRTRGRAHRMTARARSAAGDDVSATFPGAQPLMFLEQYFVTPSSHSTAQPSIKGQPA